MDCGDIICVEDDLEHAQALLQTAVTQLMQNGSLPILLGGGHEIAWPHFMGLHTALPAQRISILNIDAHFDLRAMPPTGANSGTGFLQIADRVGKERFHYACLGIQKAANTALLFQTADDLKVSYHLAEHLNDRNKTQNWIQNFIAESEKIYLTICLDAFAQAFAPGVSAPQALGLLPQEVLPYIRQVMHSGKLIALDVAELCPNRDESDKTARLGAQLIAQLFHP
jgi:formiminoglutamase